MGLARPLRRSLLLALIASVVLALAGGAQAALQPRIVGGSQAAMGQFPYQAALEESGQFICGGSIIDDTHVVTAAHCVVDDVNFDYPRIGSPSDFTVFHGGVDRKQDGGGDDITGPVNVSTVSVNRRYLRNLFGNEYDAALLTLATPLSFDQNTGSIGLASAQELANALSPPPDQATVSGWGALMFRGPAQELLRWVDVPLVPDAACDDVYSDLVDPVMLCAGVQGKDACQGDSGGPLAIDVGGTLKLAGITSFGDGCGDVPGVYTEVPETGVTAFLNTRPAVAPPSLSPAPNITGTLRVGNTVTCNRSSPTGVVKQQYFWYSTSDNFTFNLVSVSGPTFTLSSSLAGLRIACDIRVENGGGFAYPEMPSGVGPVAAASTGGGTGGGGAGTPTDTKRPTARIRSVRCSKRRRCRITIVARDPDGIIDRISAKLTFRRKACRRVGGLRRCTTRKRTKRLRVRETRKKGVYIARVRLKKGRYRLAVVAVDGAGHRSRRKVKRFRVR